MEANACCTSQFPRLPLEPTYATKKMFLCLSEDGMFINEENKVDVEEDALN